MHDPLLDTNKAKPIPSLDLMHKHDKVTFAYRTMQEVDVNQQGLKDVPHRHNYYTILWAKNACGKHIIDYHEYQIKPNKVFFVSPGQVHQVITKPGAEGDVIMFTKEFLNTNYIPEDFIRNLGLFADVPDTPPLYLSDDGAQKLALISNNIAETFHTNEPYKHDKLGAHLKLFLIECNRFAAIPSEGFPIYDSTGKQILKNFKALLEQNFSTWHKVGDYARALNITADYLNNIIKSAIGKSAKEYIQQRIILEAKRLGVHTSKSSKEIAFELGFSDPSHFSRFYKNTESKSFSDFRNSLTDTILNTR